jgi:hypothetical protein
MRERTPFRRDVLERLPNLRLLVTTGMRNAAIDLKAAMDLGISVCATRWHSSVPPPASPPGAALGRPQSIPALGAQLPTAHTRPRPAVRSSLPPTVAPIPAVAKPQTVLIHGPASLGSPLGVHPSVYRGCCAATTR